MRRLLLGITALVACATPTTPVQTPTAGPVEAPTEAPPREVASPFEDAHVQLALAYSESMGGHAVLVLHEGREVVSAFHNGWDPAKPHPLASGTKSFWGPLTVAAVEDGLVSSLDERASDTLTEWKGDPRKEAMTLRQLLSFSSGLNPDLGVTMETVPDSDMFALSLAASAVAEPGTKWAYSDSAHAAVGLVLQRKLQAQGSDLERFLQTRLLAPLGIEVGSWKRDGAGHLLMPSGARLTPPQWAAYGEFVRRGGQGPDGASLVSAEGLAACFEPSTAPPAGQFYGLGWWLTSYTSFKYDLPRMHIAGGSGGQFLIVMPEVGVTIVRFGDSDDFVDGEFLCRLFHGTDTETCPVRE